MKAADILQQLKASGDLSEAAVARWVRLAERLAVLERIADQGSVTMVKTDGERERKKFTVLVTGGPFATDPFRTDGEDLAALLDQAIERCFEDDVEDV
jgi:hypothetical protein